MQGQLIEIDIRSILQLIEIGQRTGQLCVESFSTYPSTSFAATARERTSQLMRQSSWLVFFDHGQIAYAGGTTPNLLRLQDHLQRYGINISLEQADLPAIATTSAPEYGYIWNLLEKGLLSPAQGRDIIQSMVKEVLFDLLSLHQGSFVFELSSPLSPQLITFEVEPIVTKIMTQVQEWKQLHTHIQSPDQKLASENTALLSKIFQTISPIELPSGSRNKQISIRQLARYLNCDTIKVAKAVYPYVEGGAIQLFSSEHNQHTKHPHQGISPIRGSCPRIVCIDDGASVRKTVEEILNCQGYEATSLSNPIKALSLVFQLKPDLILCDIAMPGLNGYEVCAMLRQSSQFRQTPIIMVTGKDGFVDRVKANMVGATDYLTKPFGEYELLMLVESYLNLPHSSLSTAPSSEVTPGIRVQDSGT